MRTIDQQADILNLNQKQGLLAQFAKQRILATLSNLTIGHLTIIDSDETYHFGKQNTEGMSATITVNDSRSYSHILFGGTIGVGESYISEWWSTNNLVGVIRIFVANQAHMNNMESPFSKIGNTLVKLKSKCLPNTINTAKQNIIAHYDLSNDFFRLFLDPSMMYSSAIYTKEDTPLHEAALYKLDHICKRLQLSSQDHLIEIGTGWGGFAIHAATNYGCKVTTTTISDEQFKYAQNKVKEAGLEKQIKVLKKDYRLLEGKYDKLVSIEMIEAVGHKYYQEYFSTCSNLLKEDGLMLIQAITASDQRFEKEKNNIDFIRRYIFPGGCLPSIDCITKNTSRHTNLQLVGLEDITLDYARTLSDWRVNFHLNLNKVRQMGFSNTFIRLWDFYLCYCEGGFAERVIGTSQLLFAKPRSKQLPGV